MTASVHENTPLTQDIKQTSHKKSDDAKGVESKASSSLQPRQQATSLHITFNLVTAGLGTGVFTLPWCTAGASITPALCIVTAVLALNAWTISILVEAAERHQTFDLGALLGKLPGTMGKVAQPLCNSGIWFFMFFGLVGYIIVIVDCMESLLGGWFVGPQRQYHRAVCVMIAATGVLPLCFLDQRRLAFTSVVALVANINIFGFLFYGWATQDTDTLHPSICYFGLGPGVVAMVAATMQVVVIQMCVLPMYAELENRSPAKFNSIVAVAFSVLLFLCMGFAVAGYLNYGPDVQSNVLKNFSGTYWGQLSRLSAISAVAAVFPIILQPMISPLARMEASRGPGGRQLVAGIATVCIVIAVMAMSLWVTDLGFLNVMNGALSMGAFVACVPSAVGLYLLGPRSSEPAWRATMFTLLVVGLVMAVLGLILSDNYATALKADCVWHYTA